MPSSRAEAGASVPGLPAASAGRPATRRGRPIAAIVAGTIAFLFLALLLFDRFGLRPLAEHYLAERSGREVRFGTLYVGLSAAFEPVLHVRDAQVANAAWAGDRPMLVARKATVMLAWHGLLQRRPVVERLVLEDAQADLALSADGLRNWRLTNPGDRGPGRVTVKAVEARRSTIRLAHGGLGLVLHSTVAPLAAAQAVAGDERRFTQRIEFDGSLHGAAFDGSLLAGDEITLQQTGRAFPLRGQVAGGGTRIGIDGTAADVLRGLSVDAAVRAAGPSLAGLRPFLSGAALPASGRYSVEARLKKSGDEVGFSNLQARIGSSDIAGEIGIGLRGQRPMLQATLHGDLVDAVDLGGPGTGDTPARGTARSRQSARRPADAGRLLVPERFDLSPLQRFDARLDLRLAAVRAGAPLPMRGLHLDTTLRDGRLDATLLDLGLAGGRLSGRLGIDATQRPAAWTARLDGHGMRVERLLGDRSAQRRIDGLLRVHADLVMHGDSVAALAAGASGKVHAQLSSASVSERLDAALALDGGALLSAWLGGNGRTPLHCAQAGLALRDGIGTVRGLLLDTGDVRVRGSGTVDLREERFRLLLTPERKSAALLALDRAIAVRGTLRTAAATLAAKPGSPPAGPASCGGRPD